MWWYMRGERGDTEEVAERSFSTASEAVVAVREREREKEKKRASERERGRERERERGREEPSCVVVVRVDSKERRG